MRRLEVVISHVTSFFQTYILWIGRIFFSILLFYAILFYKERMALLDSAFISFRIIDSGWFDFELGRWGGFLSQLLPLLVMKMGGSLKTFLISYSISFVLIEYLIFELIHFLYKDFKALIALLLFLCLVFRAAFYYPAIDIQIGVVVSIFMWSFITNSKLLDGRLFHKIFFYIAALGLSYFTSYFHQMVIVSIVFLLLFQIITGKKRRWSIAFILIAAIVWYYFRIYILTSSEYESQKILSLETLKEQTKRILDLPGLHFYIKFSIKEIWPTWLILFLSLSLLIIKRKAMVALFIFLYCTGFIAFNIVEYYKGADQLFYENYFIMIGLFVGVGFAYVMLNSLRFKVFFILIFVALLGHSLRGIYRASYRLTERINYEKRLISHAHKFSNGKFLVGYASLPIEVADIGWTLPFETLILSSLPGPDSSATFYGIDRMNKLDSLLDNPNVFLGPDWAITWFWSSAMNKKFFNLPAAGYSKLTTSQCDSSFNELAFNKGNIELKPLNKEWKLIRSKDTLSFVPIKIVNKSGKRLNALPNPAECASVFLSYHIFNMNNIEIVHDGLRTPLELDINDEYIQTIQLSNNLERGDYYVKIDLVTDGKRWWEINSEFTLKVR